ncbi:MAG TPA: hypothetical protein VD948_08385, partial [Rhodothermales bacterium]|nr:hypothetical protein [Rhodothermales bacterium]
LVAQAHVRNVAARSLDQQNVVWSSILVEPAAFSSLLWYVIVEQHEGAKAGWHYGPPTFFAGTYSLLDPAPPPGRPPVAVMRIEADWPLRRPFEGTDALRTLDWFSRGYLVFRQDARGTTACDLRFGRSDAFLTRADAPCIFTFRLVRTPEGVTFQHERPSFGSEALARLWRRTLGEVPAWARADTSSTL